jgi:hypothetical protein
MILKQKKITNKIEEIEEINYIYLIPSTTNSLTSLCHFLINFFIF